MLVNATLSNYGKYTQQTFPKNSQACTVSSAEKQQKMNFTIDSSLIKMIEILEALRGTIILSSHFFIFTWFVLNDPATYFLCTEVNLCGFIEVFTFKGSNDHCQGFTAFSRTRVILELAWPSRMSALYIAKV